jgi:hypothetical protein
MEGKKKGGKERKEMKEEEGRGKGDEEGEMMMLMEEPGRQHTEVDAPGRKKGTPRARRRESRPPIYAICANWRDEGPSGRKPERTPKAPWRRFKGRPFEEVERRDKGERW